jgi:hypothetical protein
LRQEPRLNWANTNDYFKRRFGETAMSGLGYVEPEAKMQNEGLMSTKIRSFKYGEGVLARSAKTCRSQSPPIF